MKCRHCHAPLEQTFLDLGFAPPSNAYLSEADLQKPEVYYPLKIKVCTHCWLVQTEDYAAHDELFNAEYAYFSSTSAGWVSHAANYSSAMIKEFALGAHSHVIEVASNDGYLLKNFVEAGIPCLGIEPTVSTATAAEKLGVPVLREFFGEALAHRLVQEGKMADLIAGNNVYAHVPDINDFTRGLKAALKPDGVVTLEFPHLMRLLELNQFDTIYHEHFSYLSLSTVSRIFEAAGLRVWHVEQLLTHGGSLRVFGCHADASRQTLQSVNHVLSAEIAEGVQEVATYQKFQRKAEKIKNELLGFLLDMERQGQRVVAYGAAAKGNTLLNFAGVKTDLIEYVCDAALSKQDKFMPGSHIPIVSPQRLSDEKPPVVLILPWNIKTEVVSQLAALKEAGTRFYIAVPHLDEVA